MDKAEKILFLEKLLDMASKKLKELGYKNSFFLFDDIAPFYSLGTSELRVNKVNEETGYPFDLTFIMHGNTMLEKSPALRHSINAIFNKWKKSKCSQCEDILLQIVDQLEQETTNGWAIGLPFEYSSSHKCGLLLWHAGVSIEQLAISLDIMA